MSGSPTPALLSDCTRYTRSLDQLDHNLPFVGTLGSHYNHFWGHRNSCFDLLALSEKHGEKNCLCENTSRCGKLNLYFDFDSKTTKLSDDHIRNLIKSLKTQLSELFPGTRSKFFVKDASNSQLSSFHFIVHLTTSDKKTSIYIRDRDEMKSLFKFLNLQSPFDIALYSGYNVRLLYSNKFDQKINQWTNRHFRISPFSNFDNDIYSLATHCPNDKFIMLSDFVKKQFVLTFVKELGFLKDYSLDQVQQRDQDDHLSLMLTEQKCTERDHQSNNSVAMLYPDNITIKCLDEECSSFLQQFVQDDRFSITPTDSNTSSQQPSSASSQINSPTNTQKKGHKYSNSDLEYIQDFALHGSQFLSQETAYKLLKIMSIQPNEATLLGQPPQHNDTLSLILGTNNQQFKCQDNQLSFSINGRQTVIQLWSEMVEILKNIEKKYSEKQLEKQNIVYNINQYINNININNNIQNQDNEKEEGATISKALKIYDEFQEIFQDYPEIHKKLKYYIFDNIDTFFYIIPIIQSENFIYYKERLYYYQPDDNCWQIDENCVRGKAQLKKLISDYLMQMQDKIREIQSKGHMYMNRLLKEFGNRVNSYNYNQYAYTLQRPERKIFDQNNHLIHFKNINYDVVNKNFIEKNKDHYNTFAISYSISQNFQDYKNEILELHQILDNIFPDRVVKDWFLNSIGKNFYSVSRQKPIIFMKGIGRNGKSLIIQLIKTTLQQYVSKGKSTLFQKESFADNSKANSEVDNVIGSKICFIEEIADTQINLQTLKELTGGGEIQTRRMRQDWADKEIQCQFYVACNTIPDFGSMHVAIANRLLAVEFETEFTEEPVLPHQKLIDYNISEKIKEDKYKQAFVSILIEYSKTNIQIPEKVQYFTQQIQSEADPFLEFFEEKIEITDNENDFIKKEQLCDIYSEYTNKIIYYKHASGKQLINSFENFLKKNQKTVRYFNPINGKRIRCYINCKEKKENISDKK